MCRGKSSLPIAILLVGFGAGKANAINAIEAGPQIPPALRPWAAWVLDTPEGKSARCPSYAGESAPVCAWPAHLALSVGERGGTFKQQWMVYAAGFVALPGDKEHWPRSIKVDGRLVPWVDSSGEPQVHLSAGRHEVTGSFAWDHQPPSLVVPSQTGLVRLTVKGKAIPFPMRENDGRLFFGSGDEQEAQKAEKVDLSVYRKLTDEVPLLLETRLTVAVSGKSREVMLARALPDGFEPRAVTSGLPLRFESDGHVRLQARPGRWDITLQSHRTKPDKSITLPIRDGLWKEGAEVWSFEAVPSLRTVNIEGVQAMDPAQTLMPTEWKNLPAYALVPGKAMTLTEQRRGDAEPAPEKLTLDRTLWLDASGQGMSVHDTLVGDFTHSWRLDVGDGTRLGRASLDGQEQFITHYQPTQRDGVEIRAGHTVIETDGRIEGRSTSVPVAGFVHDLDGLVARVNVPVGWELLHASGADQVSGSWVERWSLGELFLLLLLALGVARLYGWRVGVLALLALGLTFVDGDAPVWLWLVVMASEIVVLLPKPGPYLVGARVARIAAWVILIGSAIPFVMRQVEFALNPANVLDRSVPSRFVSLQVKENSAQPVFFLKSPQESTVSLGRDASASVLGGLVGKEIAEAYGVAGMGTVGMGAGLSGHGSGYGRMETLGRHKGEEGKMGKKPHKARHEHTKEGLYALRGPKDSPSHQEREDKVMRALAAASSAGAAAAATTPAQVHPFEYDPSIVIQTGEGLPRQAWKMATFAFHGPVKRDHSLRLYFLSPQLGRALAMVKLALLVLLAWMLIRRSIRLRRSFLPPRPLFAGLLTLALLCPWSASAEEFPADDLLESLQKRLLQAPECAPNCVSVSDMNLDVSPTQLRIQLQVSAAAPIAIALPGDNASWTPNAVTINGKPATALDHDSTGQLRLALGTGIFRVELTGSLPKRDSIQLPLPMRPRHASFSARGFEVSGIHEDGAVDDSILLARIASATDAASGLSEFAESAESAPTLPPFFLVERTLSLGLKWEVSTKVTRQTPIGAPAVIEIPLLVGESVNTADIRNEKSHGTVSLNLAATQDQVTWTSTLAESSVIDLHLDAKNAAHWSEVWRMQVAPIWHTTVSGILPVRRDSAETSRIPEWHPWPGESVHIAVERPSGVPGRTFTIDASALDAVPGLHSTHITLTIEARSSRSVDHRITLPADAEAIQIQRDKNLQQLRREGRDIVLSMVPGKHDFTVEWRQPAGLATLFRVPAVDLHVPSMNNTVNVKLPDKTRWILWLSGPFVGPVVNFWALVLVIALISIALARTRLTPLHTRHWFLLGLGLCQVDLVWMVLVVATLLGLGWRARRQPNEAQPVLYNAGQAALALGLLASIVTITMAVSDGLVRIPDMWIAGNNVSASGFAWYQDRVGNRLAQPSVFSLPSWAYRVLVMAWTLWLGLAAIRWSGWVWGCLKQHGLWRGNANPFTLP